MTIDTAPDPTQREDRPGRIAHYPVPNPTRPNVADWRVDPSRAGVLVHDMQHFFLAPFDAEFRDHLIERTAHVVRCARAAGIPVAYSVQPGSMTTEERGLVADFWGPGMRADPSERCVVDALRPHDGDVIVTKWRYSAFTRTPLLEELRKLGRDRLIVCGVYAHLGILATSLDAFGHDIAPFVVSDALGDFDAERHRLALDWAAGGCAVVTTSDELVRTVSGEAS